MSSLTITDVRPRIAGRRTIAKGLIRPLVEDDVAAMMDLWRTAAAPVPTSAWVKRLFFESPWGDPALSSLAFEDNRGRLIGCLGVMSRPMVFRGRAIQAAVGHHFLVEASHRGMRAGIELAERFLGGPQDLSLAVWNEFGRRIWTSVGGSITALQSFSWTRAIRPARYAINFLRQRGLPAPAAATLHPACDALDATLNFFSERAFPVKRSSALSDELDAVTMHACLSAFAIDRALQPTYDVSSLSWLLETLEATTHRGDLHKVAVRTASGRALGWYLYYLGRSAVADVLQVGGKEDSLREVLNHLFHHARQRGAIAVSGPMDARLAGPLSEHHCAFHRPPNAATLIHSRDPHIIDAVHAGDAFLSRLESGPWVAPETWRGL